MSLAFGLNVDISEAPQLTRVLSASVIPPSAAARGEARCTVKKTEKTSAEVF